MWRPDETRRPVRLARRGFVRLVALAASGLLTGAGLAAGWRTPRPAARKDPRAAELAALLAGSPSARALGRSYLAGHPDEADAARLVDSLGALLPPGARALPDGAIALRRSVREKVREDFETEHTVWVEGWLLARTEARLCALSALL